MQYNLLKHFRESRITRLWIAGLSLAGLVGLQNAEAADTDWRGVFVGSRGVVIDFEATNNDDGTSYSSYNISSAKELIQALYEANTNKLSSITAMVSSGYISVGINDSSDIRSGWISGIDAQGNVILSRDASNPFAEQFNTGTSILAYIFIDPELYSQLTNGADDIVIGQNPANYMDSAVTIGGSTIPTFPDNAPEIVPEHSSGALNINTLSILNSTNQNKAVSLDVEPILYSYPASTNIQFQVAISTNLSDSSSGWVTLGSIYNVTGAVTRVTVTNDYPCAFLKVIKQ